MKSPITTHVLDLSQGRPAAGVIVTLAQRTEFDEWQELACGTTNDDGRISDLMPANTPLVAGVYRLTFETGDYFSGLGIESFYPFAAIIFEVKNTEQHYHVPLLLSPFGYSTYRGS
ncbi:hydroxyisourate hydrolase [bacterium]|nr:MAG: hydroxyisourate hydrolase [candidate division KSB1 bacterium]MCE7942590.1 hydroxyisourate hydrolase [Chlorobi bacterium CHB1]MCL4709412.1 hydroxyisourate hydrolase [bacterium]MDL1875140.1 hydroxyisourate hydrolase [Cytophagia bacterium CHB2]MBC6951828.1 hydroxyisourate hydrolase [candidate division KSB1 bacterium]